MTIEPPSRNQTFISGLQRLPDGDELACALRAQLVDLLRRVVVDAAAGLHPEAALVDQVTDRRGDVTRGREILVQVRADRVVDVEPGHVEQLHRPDHGELVADSPAYVQVE